MLATLTIAACGANLGHDSGGNVASADGDVVMWWSTAFEVVAALTDHSATRHGRPTYATSPVHCIADSPPVAVLEAVTINKKVAPFG